MSRLWVLDVRFESEQNFNPFRSSLFCRKMASTHLKIFEDLENTPHSQKSLKLATPPHIPAPARQAPSSSQIAAGVREPKSLRFFFYLRPSVAAAVVFFSRINFTQNSQLATRKTSALENSILPEITTRIPNRKNYLVHSPIFTVFFFQFSPSLSSYFCLYAKLDRGKNR